jgi:hypothetical protein
MVEGLSRTDEYLFFQRDFFTDPYPMDGYFPFVDLTNLFERRQQWSNSVAMKDSLEYLQLNIVDLQVERQCHESLDADSASASDNKEEDQEIEEEQIGTVRPKDLKWLQSSAFWFGPYTSYYTEDQKQSSMQKLVQIYKTLKEINRVRIDQSKKEIKFCLDWNGPLFEALLKDGWTKAFSNSTVYEEGLDIEWLTADQLQWLGFHNIEIDD